MRKVLLVDPSPFTRRATARALAARGYRVVHTADVRAAIAAYAVEGPDVVVIAPILAAREGLALQRALRAVDPSARILLGGATADDRLFRSIGRALTPVDA